MISIVPFSWKTWNHTPSFGISATSLKSLSVGLDAVVLCGFQKRSTYHVRTTFTPRAEISCIVLLRSFLLSYNRVVRFEVFTVLLDVPAEANMHLCLFKCVSHYPTEH